MRLAVWRVAALAAVVLAAALVFYLRDLNATFATSGLSIGLCQSNEQITSATRDEINATALRFVELLVRSPSEARQQMSRRGRAATVERAPIENVQAALRSLRTSGAPVVSETYLLRFLSGSEAGLQAPCDFRDGRAVFVSRGGTATSAVTLISEEMPGLSQRTTSLWLEREDGAWRVRALHVGISRIVGMDAEQMWRYARQQRAGGHDFNAALLYAAARPALQRGSFYQARMSQDFNADMRTFVAPDLVRGEAPFTWRFGDETFHITQVQYSGFESGEVALIIDHTPATWTDDPDAQATNHRLLDGFNAAYPEWRELFDAVVARANGPGVRWGTVFDRANGYSDSQASDRQDSGSTSP